MDTLLSATEVVVSGAALGAGLAGGQYRRGPGPTRSASSALDSEIAGANWVAGMLMAAAAFGVGLAGVAGRPVLPTPFALLVTAVGLISVALGVSETTPGSVTRAPAKVAANMRTRRDRTARRQLGQTERTLEALAQSRQAAAPEGGVGVSPLPSNGTTRAAQVSRELSVKVYD